MPLSDESATCLVDRLVIRETSDSRQAACEEIRQRVRAALE